MKEQRIWIEGVKVSEDQIVRILDKGPPETTVAAWHSHARYDSVYHLLTSNELGRTATCAYDLSGRILTHQNYQAASTTYTYGAVDQPPFREERVVRISFLMIE